MFYNPVIISFTKNKTNQTELKPCNNSVLNKLKIKYEICIWAEAESTVFYFYLIIYFFGLII